MNFEGYAYQLVGGLPIFVVLLIGMALCFQQHWRNPRVCTLVGIALGVALCVRIVLPFLMQVFIQAVVRWTNPAELHGPMLMLVPTLLYSAASAVVWGLMLWAIFGGGGVVRSVSEQDDMYD